MYWGNTAAWALPPLCLIDFERVNKLVFEHIFSFFVLCSHLLLSSCNRCIHTLGSPCTLLHCVVSIQPHIQRHTVQTQRQRSQLTMHSHMIIMYMYTKGKTQTYTNTHWQKHTHAPHTPAARPPPQPLVLMDGSLITTLTLGLLSPHLSPRTCVHVSVCVSVSGSGGVSCCQHRARTHCSLAERLSLFLCSTRSHTQTRSASYKTPLNTARRSHEHQNR